VLALFGRCGVEWVGEKKMKDKGKVKEFVRKSYARIAQKQSGCGCGGCGCGENVVLQRQSGQMGYSQDEMEEAPAGSNLGLGCGNPIAIASLKEGETVLDLGSGAGFDAFLASARVGKTGRVIGVDMTDEMVLMARDNARKGDYTNVEFRRGDIEDLPVEDEEADVAISNCVINLAPDKERVFKEIYRVLKPGGRLMVSDVVLTKKLPDEIKNDEELLSGCVAGAILKKKYFKLLEEARFGKITIHRETPGFLEGYTASITFSAFKRGN